MVGGRGRWMLREVHAELVRECAEQRRRRLVCCDPLDAVALQRAARGVIAAAIDLEAAVLPHGWREHGDSYGERVVSLLNAATPGEADRYLRARKDPADELLQAERH